MADRQSSSSGTVSLVIVGIALASAILLAVAFFSGSFGGTGGGAVKNTKGATLPETPDPTNALFASMSGSVSALTAPDVELKNKGPKLTELKGQIDSLFATYTAQPLGNADDQGLIIQELNATKDDIGFIQEQALKQKPEQSAEATKRLVRVGERIARVQRIINRNRLGILPNGQAGKTIAEAVSLALEGEAGKYGYDYNAGFITNNKLSCSGFVSEALRRSGVFAKSETLDTRGFESSGKFSQVSGLTGTGTLISKADILAAAANGTIKPGDIILMRRSADGIHHSALYIGAYPSKNLAYAVAESTSGKSDTGTQGPQITDLAKRMSDKVGVNRAYEVIRPNYE